MRMVDNWRCLTSRLRSGKRCDEEVKNPKLLVVQSHAAVTRLCSQHERPMYIIAVDCLTCHCCVMSNFADVFTVVTCATRPGLCTYMPCCTCMCWVYVPCYACVCWVYMPCYLCVCWVYMPWPFMCWLQACTDASVICHKAFCVSSVTSYL